MTTIDQLIAEANRKRDENLVNWLTPANFLLVVGAAILSLVAGATILIENSFLTNVQSGMLALISGAFTVVHSKLGCEQYQSECRKLMSFHRGIASDYDNLLIADGVEDFKKRITALNDQVSAVLKSTTALPFESAVENARKIIR